MPNYPKLIQRRVPILRAALLGATAFTALLLVGCGQDQADAAAGHGHGHALPADFVSTDHTHATPEETCFICDASKRDKGRLWCREHGRYEDRCWVCHPELEDEDRLYCKEHALYEDECFLCHPELKQEAATSPDQEARSSEAAPASEELFCHEHGVAERECGICQPQLATSLKPGDQLKIRFPSATAADKVGIRAGRPVVSENPPAITAFCESQYNLNAVAKITPLASGVVRAVHRDTGDRVQAGEPLLSLHSAEVAAAKSAFLTAVVEEDIRRQAFERQQRMNDQKISAEKDFQEAEAAYRTARLAVSNLRQQLINFGLTEAEARQVSEEQDTSATLVVRAPFDGTLVERAAVVGEAADPGHAFFTIADLSTHWLALSIPADQIGQVQVGQTVQAVFPELPGVQLEGSIAWIDTSVDPRSRLVRARAVVSGENTRLKTGLFGEARIQLGDPRPATVVPRSSVQRYEGGAFVFVRDQPDLFALRRVALGNARGEQVEILAGLDPQDAVVTDGSFIVMSEFLKSRLGAGCADH